MEELTDVIFYLFIVGGYTANGEDYRWIHVREMFGPVALQVFNFFFVAVFQNMLLLAISLPALVALEHTDVAITAGDVVAR